VRKSGAITLALLGGLLLTGCLCGGCGGGTPRYRTLYDKQHHVVPRERWIGPDGQPVELYDANGNPVPPDEVRSAYNTPASYSSGWRPGPGFFYFGRPWYAGRSWGGSSSGSGSSNFGKSSPSSISRGGFGGTGHAMGGGSS